ncbi:hypothetical protein BJX62DRAFT_226498 [Aspergillus germanicus]
MHSSFLVPGRCAMWHQPSQLDDGSQAERWQWHGSPQYAPTPGNFGHTPSSPSNFSLIGTSPTTTPAELPPPQSNPSRTDRLPLLQYRDWVEGKSYNEDPPTCIHYWIEWKVTLNNRMVVKDTEQDLYPYKKIALDDTSIVVSVTRLPDKLTRQFDKTDFDWPAIENQLLEWGHHVLAGKRMKLIISFNYTDESPGTTISRRSTDKRGTYSATQAMLQELDREVNAEGDLTGDPTAWRPDPYGKKHYKLYRDELLSLVRYVQSGKRLESHADVPGMIREHVYRAERRRIEGAKGHKRLTSESAYPPITITNVLPAQTTQQAMSSLPPSSEDTFASSAKTSRLNITGLRDANVQAYCDWQQSQVGHEAWKVEFQKACDVVLDNGLRLDQIDELSDPDYFENRGRLAS